MLKTICLKLELRQNTFSPCCVYGSKTDGWPLDLPFFLARVTYNNLWRIWLGVVLLNFTMKSWIILCHKYGAFSNYGESIFFLWLGYSVKKQYLLLTKLDDRRTSYGKLRQGVTIVIYSTAHRNVKNHLTIMHVYLFV